jgi:hypothetical protein
VPRADDQAEDGDEEDELEQRSLHASQDAIKPGRLLRLRGPITRGASRLGRGGCRSGARAADA